MSRQKAEVKGSAYLEALPLRPGWNNSQGLRRRPLPGSAAAREEMTAIPLQGPDSTRRPLLVIAAIALGLRLAWIFSADVDVTNGFYFDMTWYHGMGQRIAEGMGLTRLTGAPTAEWPPGYPLALGIIFKLTGDSVRAAQLFGALCAAAACALIYLLGKRLAGQSVGLVAACLLALSPGDIFYAPLLLAEVPFTATLVAACVFFLKVDQQAGEGLPSASGCIGVGIILGAATLVRGASILFFLVFAAIWLLRGIGFASTLRSTALVCLGLVLTLVPWTVRNQLRMGEPIVLSTSLGRTLSHAHSPVEVGGRSLDELRYRMDFWKRYEHIPQPRREIEINRAFTQDALKQILEHPFDEIAFVPRRLVNFFRHDHAALEWGRPHVTPGAVSGPRRPLFDSIPDSAFAAVADGYFHLVLIAAAVGVAAIVRGREPRSLLIPLAIAYFTLLHITAFPGEPRYRHPAGPFILIAAAWAFVSAGRTYGHRHNVQDEQDEQGANGERLQ